MGLSVREFCGTGRLALARKAVSPDRAFAWALEGAERAAVEENARRMPASSLSAGRLTMTASNDGRSARRLVQRVKCPATHPNCLRNGVQFTYQFLTNLPADSAESLSTETANTFVSLVRLLPARNRGLFGTVFLPASMAIHPPRPHRMLICLRYGPVSLARLPLAWCATKAVGAHAVTKRASPTACSIGTRTISEMASRLLGIAAK
jgi:hypothetical protein